MFDVLIEWFNDENDEWTSDIKINDRDEFDDECSIDYL